MSETQQAEMGGGDARARLREQQLLLTRETDKLILDLTKALTETLQFIITRTQQVLHASHVDIMFEYADGLRVESSSDPGEIGRFIPIDRSISGLVLESRTPVVSSDLQNDPVLSERYFPRVEMDPGAQAPALSVLVAEVTLDGQAIGVINVEAARDNRFGESHLEFVEAVASQISLAITHAALFDEDNFRTATDRLLIDATSRDSDVVMHQVLQHIVNALDSLAFVHPDAAEILFPDPKDKQFLVVAYSTNGADIGVRVPIGSSVCGEAFAGNKTVMLQSTADRDEYRPVFPDMRCEMAIPILYGGKAKFPIGVLNLESSKENAFSNVGRALAERFTRRIVNAVAMTKIRSDVDSELADQLMVLAADQVLNAVHRINNHVGAIRAVAADLLEDLGSPEPPDSREVAHRLQMIQWDADHALEIPGEMRKRIAAPQESIDVNAQVEVGIAAVRIPRNVELVTDLAAGLPSIPCTALDLAIENLLLNALKAMKDRPGPLRVTTRLDQQAETFIVIAVQDSGKGMSEDELSRLFEPRPSGHHGGGLGFGMRWVRSWVRRAQGLIEVDSEPGSGTTVNIRFQIDPQLAGRMPGGGEPT
jgi:putative methionine-R-sulfoxide reductase with GAF domain/two-component sensor histidine kinase